MRSNATTLQWGIRTWMPGGIPDVELRDQHAAALVGFMNTARGSQLLVELVWRTVDASAWSEDGTGDEWGIRYTWTHRPCAEVERSHDGSRADAERSIRLYASNSGPAIPTLVTRSVTYGEWAVEKSAPPGSVPSPATLYRPVPQMPRWLTIDFWLTRKHSSPVA